MSDLNFFKYIEVIQASSAKLLASKLREINFPYHLNQIYSDGKKHYAFINAKKPLPKALKEKLNKTS